MTLSEADTRATLIDPALHARGWTENLSRREETAGAIVIIDGKPRKRTRSRVDYLLRVAVNAESQPVAVAIIEAKAEHLPPDYGLEQAKLYASCKRLNVPFVYSSNGRLFVEFDTFTGQTSRPKPLSEFPTPDELRARYERGKGLKLESEAARPLLMRYFGGEATRRYPDAVQIGLTAAPRMRANHAQAFAYKYKDWLETLPADAKATLIAVATQFTRAGTDGLENPCIFDLPEVFRAARIAAAVMTEIQLEVLE